MDWKPGRQEIIARAALGYTRYWTEDARVKDHDYQLRWNWRLGDHWQGNLGASDVLSANSYDNLNSGVLVADNTRSEKRYFGEARYRFHPRWQARVGASASQSRFGAQPLSDRNKDVRNATTGVEYLTPKGSRVGLDYRRAEGDSLNGLDNDYAEDALNLRLTWEVAGKSRVLARLGYTARAYDSAPARNFEGFLGDIEGQWHVTGKVRLNGKLFRDLDAVGDDATASHSLDTGFELGADWLMSAKLMLQGRAGYTNRDFQGDLAGVVPAVPDREDELLTASIGLSYQPFLSTNVLLSYQTGSRDSNRITVTDYSFQSVSARLLVQF